ncbi:MAG TPA: BamA/TamA family outer membrane protein, partial [bacterium]|nr:BamA/TamA family outer membrane protein [bacterium]
LRGGDFPRLFSPIPLQEGLFSMIPPTGSRSGHGSTRSAPAATAIAASSSHLRFLVLFAALTLLSALALLLACRTALAEVNNDPGDVPYPSDDDFKGIDFEIADDYRDWQPRAGSLGPFMTEDGVTFRWTDVNAKTVSIVGDFNDWKVGADPLEKGELGIFKTTIPIEDGGWRYLFVVDGVWRKDPENPASRAAPEGIRPILDSQDEGPRDEASYLRVKNGEIVVPRRARTHDVRAGLTGTYDRVNAVALLGNVTYDNPTELHPRLDFGLGYSFGRDRVLYEVGVVQPFFSGGVCDVGASFYRSNATSDRERVGDVENTLATLFFREDWRDYYEAEGFAATGGWNVTKQQRFGVRYRMEDHQAVSKTTDWGLFRADKDMRENPAMDEGQMRALALTYDIDTRNEERNPTRGNRVRAMYEWAGEEFGGDFQYRKAVLDLRRYQEISTGYYADFRVAGGHLTHGERWLETGAGGFTTGVAKEEGWSAYPLQERFYLGGVGTMRATNFKSLEGDRMLLANVELRVEVVRHFQAAVFADIGDAWASQSADPDIHTDAGIGFQDSESTFRVNVATKMDRDSDDIFVSCRIRRMF